MVLPDVIGVYVRQAGVWERANAGTPEGFSGPQVRQSGTWQNCEVVSGKASAVWETCWVNIDGELDVPPNVTSFDFDLSPYVLFAGVDYNGNGTIDLWQSGSLTNEYDNWRAFDCGRDYEILFEHTSGDLSEVDPTLDTWLNLTDPPTNHTFTDSQSGTGFFTKLGVYTVKIREKVSAPVGGNATGTYTFDVLSEP